MPAAPESPHSAFPPSVPDYHLIRVIGEGSFGQVWLARGATGTFRAVKIVRRELADGGRAFARAFRGLRHYEPISRQDESLMHVLHVGPSEPDYHFYAVIELADPVPSDESTSDPAESPSDAKSSPNSSVAEDEFWKATPDSRVIDPDSYEPLTLASMLERQRRCRVALCVETGIALCRALGVLHRNGLVHRDVKPSNIIFSLGRPKLADIDLVTPSDSTLPRQFAQGFSPPEGAGSPSADLYSLGKVLYEMSTGNDRTDFPNPPLDLYPDDEPLWADLNEVVIRACDKEPAHRYQSAQEMHDDLQVVRAGGSVKRLRVLERRQRIVGRIGIVLVLIIGLAALGFLREQAHRKSLQALAESNRRTAMRLQLAQGFHLLNEGDWLGALPSFAAARALEVDDPKKREMHEIRIQTILEQSPRLLALGSHEGEITGSEFSHDGKKVVSASLDHTARVWDAESGEPLTAPLVHANDVLLAKFSTDDKQVITVCRDATLRLWDAATSEPIRTIPLPLEAPETASLSPDRQWIAVGGLHGGLAIGGVIAADFKTNSPYHSTVRVICWSPDSARMASAGDDGEVWITDVRAGRNVVAPLQHGGSIRSLAFSGDARLLASGGLNSIARIWDANTGQPASAPLPQEGPVWSLQFSADNRLLYVGGGPFRLSGELTAWSVPKGLPTGQRLRHRMPINKVAFSPDGAFLATAGVDQAARVWEAKTLLPAGPIHRFNQSVRDLQFSPDGERILASSRDGTWRIWRVKPEIEEGLTLRYADQIADATVTPDGRWIVSTSRSGEGTVVDSTTRRPALTLSANRQIRHARLSRDGHWLAFSQRTATLLYHRSDTQSAFEPVGTYENWFVFAISNNGESMAGWSPNEVFELFRLETSGSPKTSQPASNSRETNQPPNTFRTRLVFGPNLWVWAQEFSPDGKWIALGLGPTDQDPREIRTGETRIYHADTGLPHANPLLQDGRANQVAFSPDSRLLATACVDSSFEPRRAHLWDVESGTEIGSGFQHTDGVLCVRFNADGRLLVTGGEDARAQIWDVATQRPIGHGMKHSRSVQWAEFSPDSRFLLTGSDDGTARLWDSTNGDPISAPIPSGYGVRIARFTPDGGQMLTASEEGILRLRKLPLGPVVGADWQDIASLNAGSRVTPDGEAVPLSAKELSDLFHRIRRAKTTLGSPP